jgi:hypothetical protein
VAAPLKTRGYEEACALQKRVRRQYTLKRISTEDYEYLESQLSNIITRIKSMKEDEHGTTDSDHQVV